VRKYSTPQELLRDGELETVDICLPTNLHAPLAVAALGAGKHVLVEKPMALDGAEADRMVEAAEQSGCVLMTAHVLRFHPAYQALFKLLDSGTLGPIRYAVFRRRCAAPTWGPWEFDSAQSGGGVFDLLIHDVDICLRAFGKPFSLAATGYENMRGGVDTITAHLDYGNSADVIVTGGWHHIGEYPFSMEYTVVCDRGTVEFSSAGRPATLYRADGTHERVEGPETDWYQAEIEYFLKCCRRNVAPADCLPQDSAASVKLARAMVSARTEAPGSQRGL
jgi:predicted dehydrogenase